MQSQIAKRALCFLHNISYFWRCVTFKCKIIVTLRVTYFLSFFCFIPRVKICQRSFQMLEVECVQKNNIVTYIFYIGYIFIHVTCVKLQT